MHILSTLISEIHSGDSYARRQAKGILAVTVQIATVVDM